jgi:hypothetical protein
MSTSSTTTPPQAGAAAEASPPLPAGLSFRVGDLVQVQARTWANMNQPGGVARITGVFAHDSTDAPATGASSSSSGAAMTTTWTDRPNSNASGQTLSKGPDTDGSSGGDKAQAHVSVRYVLDGRHERRVHVRYVAAYALQDEQHRFRDRSALLGRCTYCGSLRSDCGSCDQQQILNRQIPQRPASATTKHSSPGRKKRGRTLARSERQGSSDDDDSTSSSSSSVDLDKLVERQRHIDRMYKRLQARRLKMQQQQQQQQQSQRDLHGSNRRRTSHDPSINDFSTINVSGSRGRPRRRRRRLQNAQDSLALVTANPIGPTRAADRSGHRTAHHGDATSEAAGFPSADDDDSCSSSSSASSSSDDDDEVGLGVFLTRHRNRCLTTQTGRDRRNRSGRDLATVATPAKALADTLDRRASSPRRGRRVDRGVRGAAASDVRRFRVVQRDEHRHAPRAVTRQEPCDSPDRNRPTLADIEIDQSSDVSDQGQVEQSSSSGGCSSDTSSSPPPPAGAATMTRRSRRDLRRMTARSEGSTTSNMGAAMDVDDSSCGLSYQGGGGGGDDGGDDGDAEVPSQLVDLNFVQPEGDAFQLPNDLVDQTAGLPFDQLPAFFDDRLALMRQQLRVAKRELRDLERQQRAAMGTIQAASASADWRRSWYETLHLFSFLHSSFHSLTVFPILFPLQHGFR